MTGQHLCGFCTLQGSDDRCNRVQHASRLTGRLGSSGRLRINTSKTRCFVRQNRHYDSVTAYRATVDPRYAAADCVVIDEVSRFEVVAAVENDVCAFQ